MTHQKDFYSNLVVRIYFTEVRKLTWTGEPWAHFYQLMANLEFDGLHGRYYEYKLSEPVNSFDELKRIAARYNRPADLLSLLNHMKTSEMDAEMFLERMMNDQTGDEEGRVQVVLSKELEQSCDDFEADMAQLTLMMDENQPEPSYRMGNN